MIGLNLTAQDMAKTKPGCGVVWPPGVRSLPSLSHGGSEPRRAGQALGPTPNRSSCVAVDVTQSRLHHLPTDEHLVSSITWRL